MRALRIELRRSVAAGAVLMIVAIGLIEILYTTPGSWTALTAVQRAGLLLSWPLAVGVGAWQASRERMAGVGELFASSPRTPGQRLAPVATALLVAAVTGYLIVLVIGSWWVWRSPADLYITAHGLGVAVVGALSLVAATWLGLTIGRAFPGGFTAPLVTVLAVVLTVALSELEGKLGAAPAVSMLLPTLNYPYQQDALQIPLTLSVMQAVWLIALSYSAFRVGTATGPRARNLAVAPACVAAVLLLSFLPQQNSSEAFVTNPAAMTPVCTPDLPKVCVIKAHSGLLPEVTGPARKVLEAVTVLPDAPTSVMEVLEGPWVYDDVDRPVSGDVLPLTFRLDRHGHVKDLDALGSALVSNFWTQGNCDFDESADHERDAAAGDVAGAWLLERVGLTPAPTSDAELFSSGLAALTALPEPVQRERVLAYRSAVQACSNADLYTELTKGTS